MKNNFYSIYFFNFLVPLMKVCFLKMKGKSYLKMKEHYFFNLHNMVFIIVWNPLYLSIIINIFLRNILLFLLLQLSQFSPFAPPAHAPFPQSVPTLLSMSISFEFITSSEFQFNYNVGIFQCAFKKIYCLRQGYQTHFHQGPHQLRCCLQRAKCNFRTVYM